jgi:hypothetical protein
VLPRRRLLEARTVERDHRELEFWASRRLRFRIGTFIGRLNLFFCFAITIWDFIESWLLRSQRNFGLLPNELVAAAEAADCPFEFPSLFRVCASISFSFFLSFAFSAFPSPLSPSSSSSLLSVICSSSSSSTAYHFFIECEISPLRSSLRRTLEDDILSKSHASFRLILFP